VERDGGEHRALPAAEALIDGPAQRREQLAPFCALVWLEAGGKPVRLSMGGSRAGQHHGAAPGASG